MPIFGKYRFRRAIKAGDRPTAESLLKAGVDPNDSGSPPAAILAVQTGDPEMVRLLQRHGANLGDGHYNGVWRSTPLGVAIETRNAEIFDIIVESDIELTSPCFKGLPPIHFVASKLAGSYGRDEPELIFFLQTIVARIPEVDLRDEEGQTALFHAAMLGGSVAAARVLIAAGADVNAKNAKGQTPIFDALYPEIGRFLIDNGALPNIVDDFGHTALEYRRTQAMFARGYEGSIELLERYSGS